MGIIHPGQRARVVGIIHPGQRARAVGIIHPGQRVRVVGIIHPGQRARAVAVVQCDQEEGRARPSIGHHRVGTRRAQEHHLIKGTVLPGQSPIAPSLVAPIGHRSKADLAAHAQRDQAANHRMGTAAVVGGHRDRHQVVVVGLRMGAHRGVPMIVALRLAGQLTGREGAQLSR